MPPLYKVSKNVHTSAFYFDPISVDNLLKEDILGQSFSNRYNYRKRMHAAELLQMHALLAFLK